MTTARDSLWESGKDEQVEVNQRALIDKVLARYSGEFTVFRELLQNADDAQARRAEIRFETRSYIDNPSHGVDGDNLPDLRKEPVHQWSFRNDGMVFREEDWNRLKKIAEGNPDEEKIGAFGVGFYSLFSVTDEPFVKSGSSWMGFYWRDGKDQLYARRGQLPPSGESLEPGINPWTSFDMVLREPGPLPAPPVELARFLAQSLTFMARLRVISVYFNDKRLIRVEKAVDEPKSMPMPRNLNPTSPLGIMTVRAIEQTAIKMRAELLRWVYVAGPSKPQLSTLLPVQQAANGFFASLFSRRPTPVQQLETQPPTPNPDPFVVIESTVALSVYSAHVDVKMDRKLLTELERATKKKPPTRTVYHLIYTGKDDYDASKRQDEREFQMAGSVFRGLRADLEGTGSARVFIGQATAQTTGVAGHMAARFIPTVERESIDLVDRHVSVWNKELLFVGGFLCRAVWEMKMADISTLWKRANDPLARDDLTEKCLHVIRFFSVYRASPSSTFSDAIEGTFFSCARDKTISLLSTAGVLNAEKIRMPSPDFSGFLQNLPVLPQLFVSAAPRLVSALRDRALIRDITLADVLEELKARPLSEQEMIECLKWRSTLNTEGVVGAKYDQLRSQFLNAAIFTQTSGLGDAERVVPLSTIKTYLNPRASSSIPPDVPLPTHTLPHSISKNLPLDKLTSLFGWNELRLPEWISFIASNNRDVETNICLSPVFAEKVLNILGRAWPAATLSEDARASIIQTLQPKPCVPTTQGMRSPLEAYFPTAHIFADLPILQISKGSITRGSGLERVLLSLGLRKHVDLQIVFTRMVTTGDWSTSDLVQYLVAVKETLTNEELSRLQHTAAFPREDHGGTLSRDNRWMAQDLYEPNETLRQLGLPILAWDSKWKPNSEEAKFLSQIGLKRYPPVEAVLELASSTTNSTAVFALNYFLANFSDRYAKTYSPQKSSSLAFVPALQPDGRKINGKPTEVFLSPECSVFGFNVLDPAFSHAASKLGLSEHPPMSQVIASLLAKPPTVNGTAKTMFEYMGNRLADLGSQELTKLNEAPIIPYKRPDGFLAMLKPVECYFGGGSQSNNQYDSRLFHFVDFGPRANAFLRQCGVKSEPTVQEIAKMLASDPGRFYQLGGGADRYLAVLRNMAANRHLLTASLRKGLEKVPFLLCTRRDPTSGSSKTVRTEYDDDDAVFSWDLRKADEIIIIDDASSYALFSASLFAAPQEEVLEAFYEMLGSRRISQLVTEECKPHTILENSKPASNIRALVLERLPLFLFERSSSEGRGKLLLKPEWLEDHNHFQVVAVRSLRLTRQLHYNSIRLTHTSEASAGIRTTGPKTPLTLWVSTTVDVDMYEVANAMCKALFQYHTINDSLLFSTLLSTDLRALKRRGYAVNRIMQQQKIRQDALDAQERERQLQAEASLINEEHHGRHGSGSGNGLFGSLRHRLQKTDQKMDAPPDVPPKPPVPDTSSKPTMSQPAPPPYPGPDSEYQDMPGGMLPARRRAATSRPDMHVTPQSNIEANLNMAIAACRPERMNLIHNRQEMTEVKESLNEGYCDASGLVGDLVYAGHVTVHRFYTRGMNNPGAILIEKREALQRFSDMVITPIGDIYNVPQSSLHIFYDTSGPLIAFNRNGSLFLNLRYYEAWHDSEVLAGDLTKALISWFFTLAHEIAHNLVQPHNSEHEFYFSSLCEANLPRLAGLISGR